MEEEDVPTLIQTTAVAESILDTNAPTVPLTIICGFLGAGKSTLVKRILTERHGYRIAVIMNEFGDTADIEAKTINVSSAEDPSAQSEEFLELANGCLCCSIKDTGIAAIEKLMQRKGAFDHILLETTGLADPGPIASMFWQNEEFAMGLGRDIHLDGVVCVVDAVFGRQQMEEDHSEEGKGESVRQIAGADVILLNKIDLVVRSQLEETEDMIHSINPIATIYRTIRGEIDLKNIMGIDAYSSRPLTQVQSDLLHIHHHHDHDHSDPDHTHGPTHYEIRGISSLQIDCPVISASHIDKLDEWIRSVLWEHRLPREPAKSEQSPEPKLEILRCKGMIVTDSGDTFVLQGVRNLYEITKVEDREIADAGIPDEGKIILIGKGLDEKVRRSLEDVLRL
ncbi:cobW-domain-containing protein [Laetiporus sulphureus 93-53]|uniref:CobW-domain-containing protein n=1 Tax=Laetiporus sulphureus 93-53 TaxID=1314785 RepID=A0A165HNU0_9APHY|nr:cobW-domain-containing protein [Laetiporus sulphureus 93-53]KZT11985.1 cobW-domain-containing protein [Laetiporus sulphureus 93-53]